MLFLHGFGNESHIWDDFAPVVAPHYRTYALDQRGHGDSDHDPERRYEHESMVDDVEAVCKALGIDRLVLVGHSMGGRVTMRFAARHPEQLAGVVLVDVGPELDLRGVLKIRDEAVQTPTCFASVREFEMIIARNYPMAKPESVARMARHSLRERDDGRYELKLDPFFREGMKESQSSEDFHERAREDEQFLWDALAKIECPCLVVRGAASDVLSAETAERMVEEALPNGILAVVPRAGHSVMTDNPEGFSDAVAEFVLAED